MRGHQGTFWRLVIFVVVASCSDPEPVTRATIEVFGPYRGPAVDGFYSPLESFGERQGLDIRYTGTSDFASDLQRRVGNANPPDIAIVPQLGLVSELWRNERIVALAPALLEATAMRQSEEIRALGEVDDTPVALLHRSSIKSLVWYRPSIFESNGYAVPQTLDELEQLAGRMQADDLAPWCMSMQARSATGWVATDWVEDLLLRQSGPDVYQRWVDGEVGFDSPEVENAFDTFADLTLSRGRVAGGLERVLRAATFEAHDPLFTDPPGCAMHRQASWILDWVPDGFALGPEGDLDVFVLPASEAGEPPPLLLAGDFAVAFNDDPATNQVMAQFVGSSPSAGRDSITAIEADFIAAADTIVFDGSDQMPPAFGSDVFLSEITRWVAGEITYQELAAQLDMARDPDPSP